MSGLCLELVLSDFNVGHGDRLVGDREKAFHFKAPSSLKVMTVLEAAEYPRGSARGLSFAVVNL